MGKSTPPGSRARGIFARESLESSRRASSEPRSGGPRCLESLLGLLIQCDLQLPYASTLAALQGTNDVDPCPGELAFTVLFITASTRDHAERSSQGFDPGAVFICFAAPCESKMHAGRAATHSALQGQVTTVFALFSSSRSSWNIVGNPAGWGERSLRKTARDRGAESDHSRSFNINASPHGPCLPFLSV